MTIRPPDGVFAAPPAERDGPTGAARAAAGRRGSVGRAWRALARSRTGAAGLAIVVLWLAVAALAPWLAPQNAYELHADAVNQAPSARFLLGTDQFGRDVLSRIVDGSRSIMLIAPAATLLGLTLGTIIGLTTGYAGGWYDEIVMRILDGIMAFPTLIIIMLLISVVPVSAGMVTLIIGVNFAPYGARVVRSAVLSVRSLEFVDAARLRGEPVLAILTREILPNCWRPITVEGTTRLGYAIFAEAGLSFLGLGVPPPTPDWGVMVKEGQGAILVAPWAALFPSIAIATLVVGVNLVADGVRQRVGR